VKGYLAYYEVVKDAKRPKTLQTERGHLRAWVVEGICKAAIENSKNGIEFADYIRLLAYCGGRM
jgi:hypothetical protein